MHAREHENWVDFKTRVNQAVGWLQWNAKRKNYIIVSPGWRTQTIKFRHGALASVFALKWL